MGDIRLGVHEALVKDLTNEVELNLFIETGTYKGGTAVWAAQNFKQVVTIEAHPPRYEKTAAALAGKYPNLSFRLGDSRRLLRSVLKEVDEPALLWLDAHWCGNYELSQENGDECPLVEELKIVASCDIFIRHFIMIDDARLFLNPPPRPHNPTQWPEMKEIVSLLPGRAITIFEDVIYAFPVNYARFLERWTGRAVVY